MLHSTIRVAAAACLFASAACFHVASNAATLGSNLIINGNAESGTTGWTAYDGTPLFSAAEYGSNWVLPTQPGPVDRGTHLFVGGSGAAFAGGWQVASLTDLSSSIANGRATYDLSGWLGGWSSQGDNALLYVSFLDAASSVLGTVSLGPVTPADRANATGLLFRETTGLVPIGSTQVKFELTMERNGGGDNDGYADNLSFAISAVPEADTWALMLLGLGALGSIGQSARRRAARA